MKNTNAITVEQAKLVLPAWLEFGRAISEAGLSAHPSVSKMDTIWSKHFAPILDTAYYQELNENCKVKNINAFYILEVREIDYKNKKLDDGPSLAYFPNKTQFVVGVFSSKENAVKWIKENRGFHGYDPSQFFYVLLWGRMDDRYSPAMAESFYDLDGNKI